MIKVYRAALPKEFCREAIRLFNIYERDGGTMRGEVSSKYGNLTNDHFLVSVDLRLDADSTLKALSLEIGELIGPYVVKYLENFKGVLFDETAINCDDVLFSRYERGEGKFGLHKDSGVSEYERSITVICYFNDVLDGGETYFVNQDKKVKPEEGSIVIFPSGFEYAHQGLVPESEDKYITVTFVDVQIGDEIGYKELKG